MAGIKFDITGDNRNFLDSMKEVQDDVRKTSKIIESVGKNFDISSVDEKIVSLTKVIRQNEDVILKHQSVINKWKKDADAAFSKGDMSLFNTITKDIDAEAKKIQELVDETNKYRDALAMVNAMAGNGTNTVSLPMLFNSEEEYRNVQRLTSGIAELRMKIATFDGSDAELQGLRSQLSGMQDELRKAQMSAAEAASALGENGERAAETSQRYFQLSDAVSNQEAVVAELTNKLNAAASAMEQAKASGDTEAIDNATIKYDALADQVQNAKMELISMNAEFGKVKEEFQGDTTESLRNQLRKTTLELATLTLTYRQMSAEERNSAKGRAMAEKLQELTKKAGDLRDTMSDVSRAIQATASDTKNFDAAAGGFNVLTSTIGATIGTLSLFGAKQEDLIDIQTKLQASLAISNALSVIQNNLQKESALMIAITNIQKKAEVIGENLVVAAKGRNIIVTKAATVAQAALNVVAKANPYVLLATALISVVGALALFAKGTKEATEAEKLQQEALEREKDAVEKYQSALSNSYANLMTKYSDLRREWNNLANDHERTKWIKDNQNAFNELGLKVNNVTDAESVFRNNTQNVVDSFKRRAEAAALAAQMTELYRQQMDLEQKFTDRYNQRKVRAGETVHNTPGVMTADKTGGTYNGGKYTWNQGSGHYAYTEKGAEEYNTWLLKSDATLNQINEEWKGVGEKIDEADKKLQKLGNTGKKVTTTTTTGGNGNDPRAFQRYNAMIQEYLKNRVRYAENLHNSTTQAEIDAMEDGNDKTMRQIQLDFEKRKTEIERAYEDLKQKKIDEARKLWEANPDNKGKLFDESSVDTSYSDAETQNYRAQLNANLEQYKRSKAELAASELQDLYNYLKEYGTIEQQRYAITKEYDEKIAKEKSETRRKALEAEKKSALSSVNAQSLAMSIDWNQTFSGIGNVLEGIAKETLSKVKEYMKTDEYKGLGAADKKSYQDLVSQLQQAGGIEGKSPLAASTWNDIGKLTEQYKQRVKDFLAAQETHKNAVDLLIKAEKELAEATTPTAQAVAQMKVDLAKQAVEESAGTVDSTGAAKDEANQNLHTATDAATKGLQDFQTTLGNLTSGTLSGFANGVAGVINSLSSKTGKAADGLIGAIGGKAGGLIGAILQIIDALGDDPSAFISNILNKVADVIDKILSTLLTEIVPAVLEGVANIIGSVIEGVANLVTFGAVGSIFGGKGHEEEYKKELEDWKNKIEANTYAVQQLTEKMKDKTKSPSEAASERDAALSALQGQIASNRGSANLVAGDSDKGYHSWIYKRNDAGFDYSRFNNVLAQHGSTARVGSAQGVLGLSAKDIQILRTYAGNAWADYFGDVDSERNPTEVKNYLEAIGDLAERDTEIISEFYATLTNMSFDDLRSDFKSKMMDMKSDAKDFTNDFAKMMTDSLMDSFMATSGLNEAIKQWQIKWGKYLENDNTLSEAELADLQREYEALVKQAMEVRDQAAKMTGYADTYEQEASSNGFQAMSQDLGEEVSGRFTAVQIAGENISAQMLVVVATMNSLAAFSGSTNGAVIEIRNLMIMTNSYLEDVVKYAKLLYNEFGEKLDDIVNNTKNL